MFSRFERYGWNRELADLAEAMWHGELADSPYILLPKRTLAVTIYLKRGNTSSSSGKRVPDVSPGK